MIDSLFIVSRSNEVLLEKHSLKVLPKSVCQSFFDLVSASSSSPEQVPAVYKSPDNFILMNIYQGGIFFLGVCQEENPPLLVIEFLKSVSAIIDDYFGSVSETVVRENLVTIFELIDEMLDSGLPSQTESNILKQLVRPPSLLKAITDAVTGQPVGAVSDELPGCHLSSVRWRRKNVKYTNNEAYFDIVEVVSAIVDKSGNLVAKDVKGSIECSIKLSGQPDLTLSFVNAHLIDDASLHHCVRMLRWQRERVLSFVPPDGRFQLFTYHISPTNMVNLPLTVRHNVLFRGQQQANRMELSLTPRTSGKALDSVKLSMIMPIEVTNVIANPSCGRTSFDLSTRLFDWDVGRIEPSGVSPSLKANLTIASGSTTLPSNPTISVKYNIQQYTVSGLKVARVDMYSEKYKPFKGVKYATKTGQLEIRT